MYCITLQCVAMHHILTGDDDGNKLGAEDSLSGQSAGVGVVVLQICCHDALLSTQKVGVLVDEVE